MTQTASQLKERPHFLPWHVQCTFFSLPRTAKFCLNTTHTNSYPTIFVALGFCIRKTLPRSQSKQGEWVAGSCVGSEPSPAEARGNQSWHQFGVMGLNPTCHPAWLLAKHTHTHTRFHTKTGNKLDTKML